MYLIKCSLGQKEFDNGHQWNAHYGGKCHEPAKSLGPSWVVICLVVRQRFIGHQAEDEYTLCDKEEC